MSTDLHHAKNYGSIIKIITLKKNARMLTEKQARSLFKIRHRKNESLLNYYVRLCIAVRDAGYAGIEFEHQGDVGTVIFDQKWIKKRRAE